MTAWVDGWGAEVASVDLNRLHAQQWSRVWPKIEDFRFLTEDMKCRCCGTG